MAARGADRVARLGILLGVALVLHAVESLVPMPAPFVRVGLANIVTLVALLGMGFGAAVLITVLRVVIGSLIVGTFLGPGFVLSMAGGLAAVLVMGAAAKAARPPLGVVGVSLTGAAAHNLAQLGAVAVLYTGAGAALRLAPVALVAAAASGFGVGLVALFVLEKLPFPGR
jgi:heptaprenyl diphosphate synthase